MNPTIKEQRRLMTEALKQLDDIDTVQSLIGPMDPITCKVLVADLQCKYIETMLKLQHELLKANTYELA